MRNLKNKIELKVLGISDKMQMAKLLNNKKILNNLRNHIPYPYTEKDAETFIESVKNDPQQQVFSIYFEGNFCGIISLIFQNDIYENTDELGYWLGETYWGKGIAGEAVSQITRIGFEDFRLRRIFAKTFENNLASMSVLEKNGYKREGILKKAILKNGKILDEYVYGKLHV